MFFLLANSVFLISSIGYGWLAGDDLDRQAISWIVAALLGTFTANAFAPTDYVLLAIVGIDILLLIGIARIALQSPRYWPTWFAGLHLAGVACGALALTAPAEQLTNLRIFAGLWGVLALLAMVFGLFLDRRSVARGLGQAQPST